MTTDAPNAPAMASQQQQQVGATSSVDEISRATFTPQKICNVYTQKWNSFKAWVYSTAGVGPTDDGKYLTRDNVDKFFLLEVQYRGDIMPKNLVQWKNAMEAYAKNVEHPPPGQAFEVNSPLVQQAMTGQKALYKANHLQKVECAHANMYSDTLSDGEKLWLLNYGMQQITWADYCTSQTNMTQSTMRGNSLCSSRLADLHHNHVHGPMDGKYPMLGFIEQDYVGKVTHESKTISGMWRHQDWMQCGSGWIAVSVI